MSVTEETSAILSRAGTDTSLGLRSYDLQAPAKELIPLVTPLRNKLPRVSGGGDIMTHWKAVTGINTANLTAGVGEGQRNAANTTGTADLSATYKGLGHEDFLNFEADYAAKNFTNLPADVKRRLLMALMISEERVLFGGQGTWGLGTTPTPTTTTSGTGGTIAAATYIVNVVALTHYGYRASVAAGAVNLTANRTNLDSTTTSIAGGYAAPSANASQTTTGSTSVINWSVTPVAGAAGYAVFVGTSGNQKLYGFSTTASGQITSIPSSSQALTALAGTDQSQDSTVFDGMSAIFAKSGSGSYVAAGSGSQLTSDGAAGINEFNTAFDWFWNNWRLSPDDIWCSGAMAKSIDKLIIANGGAPIIRYTTNGADGAESGRPGRVSSVLNKTLNKDVRINVHPDAPDSWIMFTSDSVPFPSASIGNPLEIRYRRDYHGIDWPLRTRRYEFGVYTDEVLACYAPGAFGLMHNFAP